MIDDNTEKVKIYYTDQWGNMQEIATVPDFTFFYKNNEIEYGGIVDLTNELRENIYNTNKNKVLTNEEKIAYFERAIEIFTTALIEKFCEGENEE
jgi:hypothetical protein